MKLIAEYRVLVGDEIHLKREYNKLLRRIKIMIKQLVEFKKRGYIIKNLKPVGFEKAYYVFFHIRIWK